MQGDFDRLKATIARAAMKRIVAAGVYEGQRYIGRGRYPVDHSSSGMPSRRRTASEVALKSADVDMR